MNWAAKDLGVPQSSLQRVVEGTITSPRTHFAEAFRTGLDVSTDWLIAGVGTPPGEFDEAGRPLVAGVPRWRRIVRALSLDHSFSEHVLDLPFAVWRATTVLSLKQGVGVPAVANESLTKSLESWSDSLEVLLVDLDSDLGDAMRHVPELVRYGFSATAVRIAASPKGVSHLRRCLKQLDSMPLRGS